MRQSFFNPSSICHCIVRNWRCTTMEKWCAIYCVIETSLESCTWTCNRQTCLNRKMFLAFTSSSAQYRNKEKSVFVEFVSNRNRGKYVAHQQKKSIKQANEQHQNGKAMRKTRPVVTKTLNFHFWATIWHVLVIWSASSCARIWKDFPNKSNDDFVTVLKWDGVNCNIIQICHFMASNETGFELCLRCMTSSYCGPGIRHQTEIQLRCKNLNSVYPKYQNESSSSSEAF